MQESKRDRAKERDSQTHMWIFFSLLYVNLWLCIYSPETMCPSSHTHMFQVHTARNLQQPQMGPNGTNLLIQQFNNTIYLREEAVHIFVQHTWITLQEKEEYKKRKLSHWFYLCKWCSMLHCDWPLKSYCHSFRLESTQSCWKYFTAMTRCTAFC